MDCAMYIFVNKGLGMSTGKAAAQAAHAAVEAFQSSNEGLARQWYIGGHYKKLVMEARDAEHLYTIEKYLEARGFKTVVIIDEGMTEIEGHQPTALGVEIVNKDSQHTAATFGTFKLYRDEAPTVNDTKDNAWQRFWKALSSGTKEKNRAS